MKKSIAILLSLLMLVSCISTTNVFGQTTDTQTNEDMDFCYSQAFCDSLNKYIDNLSLGEYYGIFTTENIKTTDKIIIYENTQYHAIIRIIGSEKKETSVTAGDFTFNTDTFFHQSNPCGFVTVYGFGASPTIKDNEYEAMYLPRYAALFPNTINHRSEDIQSAEKLLNERYKSYFNLVNLGKLDDNYSLYYNTPTVTTNMDYTKYISSYEIRVPSQQHPYDIGLFVISSDTAYEFEEACEKGIVSDMEAVLNILSQNANIHFNFSIKKMEKPKELLVKYCIENGGKFGAFHNFLIYLNFGTYNHYQLLYGGMGSYKNDYFSEIGKYTIKSHYTFKPYPLGLFIFSNDNLYTLEDAYKAGVISDDDMNNICEVLRNRYNEKYGYNWESVITGNHIVVTREAVAPTCTKSGRTEGKYCSFCNETLVKQEILPATGHKVIPAGKESATYFSKGYSGDEICDTCGDELTKGKIVPKLKLKTPNVKITASKKNIKVKYNKVKNATGFQVKYKVKNKVVYLTYNTKKAVTKTIKDYEKGNYKVYVRSFIKQGNKKAYSNWTKAKTLKIK